MLEFYYKHDKSKFKNKSLKLFAEVLKILEIEGIVIEETENLEIPVEYQAILGNDLFGNLNNLYFTLRNNNAENHTLLKKYLPELKKEPRSQLLFADFFSGAGGLSQGLINAGFVPAFVNDNFIDSLETYYFNHFLTLDRFFYGDIFELVEKFNDYQHFFEGVKLIAGGPPCQGFSSANRRNYEIDFASKEKRFIEDKRNILYKHFVQLIGLIKPDFFIIENVRGMKKVEMQIEEDITFATHQEYFFNSIVIDAQTFGIPQSRIRYILIGGKNIFSIEQIKTSLTSHSITKKNYKLGDALYGLPEIKTNPFKLNSDYESHINGYNFRKIILKQNSFLREINMGRKISFLWNHRSRYNNNNDLEIFRRLPEGANSLHESIQDILIYKRRNHIFKDKYYKLKHDEVSKTITSHMKYDCHMYIHPKEIRGISPREAARIQTFSDDYVFRGSLNSWYKQIGNAVPVKLAEIIAKEIKKISFMKYAELFSGIGGFRQAADLLSVDTKINLECVAFSEIDSHAIKTYESNFNVNTETRINDVVEFTSQRKDVKKLAPFDLLLGGFPCQSFSLLGKQGGLEDERGKILFSIHELLAKKKPKFIVLENVRNIIQHNKGETLTKILDFFKSHKYKYVNYVLLNSQDFGLPQRRSRVFFVCSKRKLDLDLSESAIIKNFTSINAHSLKTFKNVRNVLDKQVDKKYYLSEKIKHTILADGSKNFKSKSQIDLTIGRTLTATMVKMHRACQDNYYSDDFIQKNISHKNSTKEMLLKMPIRKLTPWEALKLQGFDKKFYKRAISAGVSEHQLYKQAGNALNVNTGYALLHYLFIKCKIQNYH